MQRSYLYTNVMCNLTMRNQITILIIFILLTSIILYNFRFERWVILPETITYDFFKISGPYNMDFDANIILIDNSDFGKNDVILIDSLLNYDIKLIYIDKCEPELMSLPKVITNCSKIDFGLFENSKDITEAFYTDPSKLPHLIVKNSFPEKLNELYARKHSTELINFKNTFWKINKNDILENNIVEPHKLLKNKVVLIGKISEIYTPLPYIPLQDGGIISPLNTQGSNDEKLGDMYSLEASAFGIATIFNSSYIDKLNVVLTFMTYLIICGIFYLILYQFNRLKFGSYFIISTLFLVFFCVFLSFLVFIIFHYHEIFIDLSLIQWFFISLILLVPLIHRNSMHITQRL